MLLAILPIVGCGTVANVAGARPEEGAGSPFGGVRRDVACMKRAANGEFGLRAHPKSEAEQYPQLALVLFCAVDLPFSLVGDIVTWPFTLAFSFINEPLPPPPVPVPPPPGTVAIPTLPAQPGTPALPAIPTAPGTRPMPLPTPPAPLPLPMPLPTPPATPAPTDGRPQSIP